MPLATSHAARRKRIKRTLKRTSGYYGNASRLYRYAKQASDRAGQFSYRDRRKKKSTWRQLWIIRINAACRANGIAYSRFIAGLKAARIEMDRKALAQLAVEDAEAFTALVDQARKALDAQAAPASS